MHDNHRIVLYANRTKFLLSLFGTQNKMRAMSMLLLM